MNLPSISPTFTAPVGPSNGMSDIVNAMDEPNIPAISGEQSWSTDNTVTVTVTSFLNPLGKRGLKGLSINREVSIALSPGFPSLLMKPPGIFPTEYNFSSKSTLKGKKSIPSLGSLDAATLAIITVSPYLTIQEPLVSSAILPVVTVNSLPASSYLKTLSSILPPVI